MGLLGCVCFCLRSWFEASVIYCKLGVCYFFEWFWPSLEFCSYLIFFLSPCKSHFLTFFLALLSVDFGCPLTGGMVWSPFSNGRHVLSNSLSNLASSLKEVEVMKSIGIRVKPSWKSLFAYKQADNLFSYYFASKDKNGRILVDPSSEVVMLGVGKWEEWLVRYFVDFKLLFSYMKSYLDANQKRLGKYELLSNQYGCFLFKLKNNSLNEEVLDKGL